MSSCSTKLAAFCCLVEPLLGEDDRLPDTRDPFRLVGAQVFAPRPAMGQRPGQRHHGPT